MWLHVAFYPKTTYRIVHAQYSWEVTKSMGNGAGKVSSRWVGGQLRGQAWDRILMVGGTRYYFNQTGLAANDGDRLARRQRRSGNTNLALWLVDEGRRSSVGFAERASTTFEAGLRWQFGSAVQERKLSVWSTA